MKINLSNRLEDFPLTKLNGPGLRYSLFVQGCPLLCTDDCLNDPLLPIVEKEIIEIDDIANYILELKNKFQIEGVTFLGGEPFAQAEGLALLAEKLHAYSLSVMTYSGYRLSSLLNSDNRFWKKLLRFTDILVEGPFIARQRSSHLLWRGSSNQRILLTSKRYSPNQLNEAALYPENAVENFEQLRIFNRNTGNLEVHWSNLIKLDQSISTPIDPNPFIQWNPEYYAYLTESYFVEKGIIAMITDSGVSIFGHQTKATLDHLYQILSSLGVNLQKEKL